jgi:hypothetical protein
MYRCKEYTFDDGISQTLRRNTLEYKSAFTEIAEILEPA